MSHSSDACTQCVSVGRASKMLGGLVQGQTLAIWCRNGVLPYTRTKGNQIRIPVSAILALKNGDKQRHETKEKVIIYCRVSSQAQEKKGSLARQVERVTAYAREHHKGKPIEVYSETASGFSVERKQLWAMLDKILSGDLDGSTLICADRDRLSRLLIGVFEKICQRHNIAIVFIESKEKTDDEIWTTDLISFITWYSVRYSSKKSGKRLAKPLGEETIKLGLAYLNSGLSVADTTQKLKEAGHSVTTHRVNKYIFSQKENLATIIPAKKSSAQEWKEARTAKADANTRLLTQDAYLAYQQWATENGKIVVSHRRFALEFKDVQFVNYRDRKNGIHVSSMVGLVIKGRPDLTKTVRAYNTTEQAKANDSLDELLKYTDKFRGSAIHSTELMLGYRKHCRQIGVAPLFKRAFHESMSRLALGVQLNGRGFIYQL